MKFNELKEAYFELKRTENELNMPVTKAEKANLDNKQTELRELLLKYEILFIINAKELNQTLENYFNRKNVQVDVEFGETVEKQTSECFEGIDTCIYHYPYISFKYNDKTYKTEITATFGRRLSSFNSLDFSILNFQTNILKILDGFFNRDGLIGLYEDFDDILDVLWNLVLENIKRINKQKIDKLSAQQEAKRNLIVELTDHEIIAKKVEKIEKEISELEIEKGTYSNDELDNIFTTCD